MGKGVIASRILARAATRFPLLRGVPVVRLLAVAELVWVARLHIGHLDAVQRRRLGRLLRRGRRLSAAERDELRTLMAALDARAFAGSALKRFSPVPLPKRLTRARY
jgi:hypothetical protein